MNAIVLRSPEPIPCRTPADIGEAAVFGVKGYVDNRVNNSGDDELSAGQGGPLRAHVM
jgi:hypothetical protein